MAQRSVVDVLGLPPAATLTLRLGCVDPVGNVCQDVVYTWATAPCPEPQAAPINLRWVPW
jgi:hypothetical protein